MSQLFAWVGQSIGVSASASVLPMNIQGWFPLDLPGLISLLSKELSRVFSSTTIWKYQFFITQPSLLSNTHIHTKTTGKTIALTIQAFVSKVMSLLFNILSRFVIAVLPRKKCLFCGCSHHLQWFLEPKKIKSITVSIVSHLFAMKWWDQMP